MKRKYLLRRVCEEKKRRLALYQSVRNFIELEFRANKGKQMHNTLSFINSSKKRYWW